MKTFSITDTGVLRTMNQDYCFSSDTPIGNLPNLYIVCDGMGGHSAGEVVQENYVASSCSKDGSYDLAAYCTVCGAECFRETVYIPMVSA